MRKLPKYVYYDNCKRKGQTRDKISVSFVERLVKELKKLKDFVKLG